MTCRNHSVLFLFGKKLFEMLWNTHAYEIIRWRNEHSSVELHRSGCNKAEEWRNELCKNKRWKFTCHLQIIHDLSCSELNSSWQISRWLSGPKVLKLNGLSSFTSTLNFQGQFVIGMDHFANKMRQNAGEQWHQQKLVYSPYLSWVAGIWCLHSC